MSELQEKKFGYVVHPPHHHCVPPCPPPGPIPPGMSVKDWTDYINSYIDVRARQIYDKLKGLVPGGGGEKTTVTYVWSSDITDDDKTVGTLSVDGQRTEVKVPDVEGTQFAKVLMKDTQTDSIYEVYIENGELKSKPHQP